jgi:(2R)-sulfolactate sulfo-lyase subunit alpha
MDGLMQLSPSDNVGVLTRHVTAGESLQIAGHRMVAPCDLALGHKVALRSIAGGEPVVKYGAPIGSATANITAGEHVHLHNMRSNYLPTFTLKTGEAGGRDA